MSEWESIFTALELNICIFVWFVFVFDFFYDDTILELQAGGQKELVPWLVQPLHCSRFLKLFSVSTHHLSMFCSF